MLLIMYYPRIIIKFLNKSLFYLFQLLDHLLNYSLIYLITYLTYTSPQVDSVNGTRKEYKSPEPEGPHKP